ncbi:protein-PII uridylyltransferase [Thiopseudomonas alkaliphila]|uniref:Bifunctional uridylyltransferase/uridylyl-removing enzyme n=1 Tax=Thiopseudomonas alkaliphila TaxID=1697053 RepID=A0A0K1XBU3_9GAMM|nr:[protein-PII] uridylyltransferase [Thiopseudomonas alkaliphila]AKX58860.1 protein-PII uridylyltransferase [Thiopseudomonas alkaliphila]
MSPITAQLFDETAFAALASASAAERISLFRQVKEESDQRLDQLFAEGHPITPLIHARAWVMDQLLLQAWQLFAWPASAQIALVAVGGYGRGELHPHSDIDIMLLTADTPCPHTQELASQFITLLWDLGLNIGHSVRTLSQCSSEAADDLSVVTTLMESRTLVGDPALLAAVTQQISTEQMWPSAIFFLAKLEEQRSRHLKYNDTEYNLEPNVKTSPGGLRDIQTVLWVARRQFNFHSLEDLQRSGFLTDTEYSLFHSAREFLWQVRYALHVLAGREEDRLLLDYQRKIAEQFGYSDNEHLLAIEQFMQKYYRTVMGISKLCDLLSQYFEETILRDDESHPPLCLNKRFQVRAGYLEVTHPKVFRETPFALLEAFVLLAQNPEIKGVQSATIRLLRDSRHLIDENFRQDIRNTSLFIELFKSKEGIHMNLRRMHRYGILGRYLPEFGAITGQMQHDLYHIYTVDAHTLNLIKHLRKLRHPDFAEKFSLASAILARLPKPELIYLAGLYHDIGKGRGGNHSELGAVDAEAFCIRHRLPIWDTRLITWLVKSHLIMSATAQRKDISDPQEIHNFARLVGDQTRLDYLYVLTVADINATNPTLWNSWRAQLLRQLYSETRRALRRGLANPLDREEQISTRQSTALSLLCSEGVDADAVKKLWKQLGEEYFLRHSAGDVAWHTQAILEHANPKQPLVLIRESTYRETEGGTQLFIYAPNRIDFFAVTVAALDQLNLSTQDARIITASSGFTIETYIVLDADGERIGDNPEHIERIRQGVLDALLDTDNYPSIIQRRVPRQLKHFAFTPQVSIHNDAQGPHTVIEIIAPDRPGLLVRIARLLLAFELSLHSAKILTLGERIEDVFFITDQHEQPLSDPELCEQLYQALMEMLTTAEDLQPRSPALHGI